jgi:threonine dehydratase
MNEVPGPAAILAAAERIAPYIHRTPVLQSELLNDLCGMEVYFKCENFQKIGAFKIRGGMNAALQVNTENLTKGLATHSSGNHAQAIAKAAQVLGVPAYIVMPKNSPQVKVDAVKGYGAQIIFSENTLVSREETLESVVAQYGAYFIHPYNNYDVICGQATCAKELIDDVADLDVIMAPVGGGGLISGTLLSAFHFSKATVYGAEPQEVNDAWLSLQTGILQEATGNPTLADGLKTALGDKTFPIIKQYIQDIWLVSETEIIEALALIYSRLKIVIEPSCAVPFAALLKNKSQLKGKKVGIILTGGNVDLQKLPF